MLPGVECISLTVQRMETESGEVIRRANPGNRVVLHTEPSLERGGMGLRCQKMLP
jgi:hypothetical protein